MGYEVYKRDGKTGLRLGGADEEKTLLEPQFETITEIAPGLLRTESDGCFGLVGIRIVEENEDKPWKYRRWMEARVILKSEHESVDIAESIEVSCVCVKVDGRLGILETEGQHLICGPKYNRIVKGESGSVSSSSGRRRIVALVCDERWNYISQDSYEFDRSLNYWRFSEPAYDRIVFAGPGAIYGLRGDAQFRIK